MTCHPSLKKMGNFSPSLFNGKIAFAAIPVQYSEIYSAKLVLSPPVPNPSINSTGILVDSKITLTFTDDIDPTTIDTNTFSVNGITGSVSYDVASKTATFTPVSDLNYETTYTATITTGVEDYDGNQLQSDFSWSFTTGSVPDTTPPAVNSNSPLNGANGVLLDSTIIVTFSEDMDPLTIDTNTFAVNNGVSGSISYDIGTKTATFTPTANLTYTVLNYHSNDIVPNPFNYLTEIKPQNIETWTAVIVNYCFRWIFGIRDTASRNLVLQKSTGKIYSVDETGIQPGKHEIIWGGNKPKANTFQLIDDFVKSRHFEAVLQEVDRWKQYMDLLSSEVGPQSAEIEGRIDKLLNDHIVVFDV